MFAPLVLIKVGATFIAVLTLPTVPVAPAKLKTGKPGFIVRLTVAALDDPAAFVATIVNMVAGKAAVGVPLITHVEVLIVSELGKIPAFAESDLIPQEMMGDPLLPSVAEIISAVPTTATFAVAP
jgi:hypothetical protein